MRKVFVVLTVVVLLVTACTLPSKTLVPATPLPSLPTNAPTQPLFVTPTDIPNTPTLPPTEAPPSTETIPPTVPPPSQKKLSVESSTPSEFASVLFQDDFSTDQGVWPQNKGVSNEISITEITNGELVVNLIQEMHDLIVPFDFAIDGPVMIQVEARLLEGDHSASYGFTCAYEDDYNFYGMTVAENGYIEIFQWDEGKRETLQESSGSTAIRRGTNVLKAVCDEDMVGMFANDELVASYLSLSTLSGDVGLMVGTLASGNIKVGFDNFVLMGLNYDTQATLPTEYPVATIAPELPSGVLFFDDFESENEAWGMSDDDFSTEWVEGGLLMAKMHKTYFDISYDLDIDFGGPLQVDVYGMSLEGNKNTAYGVMCGFLGDGNYYGMTVTELRHASIYRWANDIREPLWDLYDVPAIQRDGNHLTGVCDGRTLEFYVNGQLLKTIKVYQSIEGKVGVVGGSRGSNEVVVGFDDFTVTSLE